MKKKEYLISNEEKICILISLIYLISILWINFNGEYSYAAEPPVQFRLSHLSRRSEPL